MESVSVYGKRHNFKRFIGCCFIVGFAFLLVTYPAMLYMIEDCRKSGPSDCDAIIILGAGLYGSKVSHTLRERLDTAIPYIQSNSAAVIVSGGQGADELVSEAFAMKEYLVEKGIDPERIVMEDKSTSTKENILYSRKILNDLFPFGCKTVIITNDFHCPRALLYARKAGLDAAALSAKTAVFMEKVQYPREYLALVWYYVIESWQIY